MVVLAARNLYKIDFLLVNEVPLKWAFCVVAGTKKIAKPSLNGRFVYALVPPDFLLVNEVVLKRAFRVVAGTKKITKPSLNGRFVYPMVPAERRSITIGPILGGWKPITPHPRINALD
jgi:hypothetical protein